MAQLCKDYQKFVERDTEVIAIGPENKDKFAKWWHEHKMPFIGIPDAKHDIAKKLYKQQSKLLKGGLMPAMVVIDKDSKIRLTHYANSMRDIPHNKEILALLDTLNKGEAG
jgi:peroxiredoxin Q/BCP